ncbi:cytochrome P450 [Actinopolyspora erythraea]|uniref:6-deoxyerythronolide B hydroxylase n=1 Tax=Actinopolyspora erythraea TaxID=414996 RepID=A0A099D4T8_9ACTN|nr:6-deoxyerythronolide B hydroxylase [Actinopolyspora erythraea]AIS23778.1 6-deoxyerythronolide B hydroxylase [Actinopolyspora erythraea]ASU79076.1 cytochrome P450 [Actinopolyspora erythraea]KGI81198.1 cytochrome P450 [Actinopolyspora erythraea]
MTTVPDLESDSFHVDWYRTYAELRETSPVTSVRFLGQDAWLITGYDEAKAALNDLRLSSDPKKKYPGVEVEFPAYLGFPEDVRNYFANNMGTSDPPTHTRLRKLVSQEFTVRRVEAMRPRVERITSDLLDQLGDSGEGDVVDRFAHPLPIKVICELLGVDERYRGDFGRWSSEILVMAPERAEARGEAAREIVNFILELIERRRTEPGDDLLSGLIRVQNDDADRLSADELASVSLVLLLAGFEASVSLIGIGTYLLLTHPEQLALVRRDPSAWPNAVEEILRCITPPETTTRFATEELEIGGVTIPRYSTVLVAGGAANRDPKQFPNPDRFDVTRDTRGHLAFGQGIHFCMGRPLAKLEGEVALRALFERFPDLSLGVDADDVLWRRSLLLRGIDHLPVRLEG